MNIISKLTQDAFNQILRGSDEVMETAKKIKVGKIKMSEANIIARGGPGISRRSKKIMKKALHELGYGGEN